MIAPPFFWLLFLKLDLATKISLMQKNLFYASLEKLNFD
jgi:hypothetical protein